jgi:TolA-binding protein
MDELRRRHKELILVLAIAGIMCSLSGRDARAQDNRQLVTPGSTSTGTTKRTALVIGNGAYSSAPPLKNPPNDARDMAATLRALGFDVTSGINVNQREMKRLIREFGQKLKAGGSGLFYYAGHGVQSKGRNYLIPVDANIQSEAEVEDSGVDAALVLNFMDDAQNGLNIVILDACRNNPFSRSFRSASSGLAQVDAPTGTLIAYATAPGRVASDGTGQNGLYTSELLKQMQEPGLTATEMFMRVRAEVMKQTGSKQVPWEASSLVGSFYFSGGPANSSSSNRAETNTRIDSSAFELSYWETIKNSNNADDFKAYLEKYPSGQFASLAKNRINSLDAPTKPVESRTAPANNSATELAFWDSIKNSTSADDYRAYLEKYPNGDFAGLAKRRLAPLETAEKEKAKANAADNSTSDPPSVDPTAKIFMGYLGIMSAGFTARPGKLTISTGLIQFIWDKGTQGIMNGRTDGLSGSKTVDFHLLDPKPKQLQCSYFTMAKADGFFIREINTNNPEALSEAIGWGGAVARFRASSPAEAAAALAAVREACNKSIVK